MKDYWKSKKYGKALKTQSARLRCVSIGRTGSEGQKEEEILEHVCVCKKVHLEITEAWVVEVMKRGL